MVNMKFNWKEALMWLALQEKMKLDWELIGIILLFLIMALAGASQANTFYNPKPRDFASIYNMKFTNWQFQVSDNDSFLALQPAMTVAGVKYKINATTPNLNQFNSSVINKTTSYKFSFNISVSAIVRSNVNNFSLDIVGNTGKIDFDNKLHELYMDDLIINFDDLIDAGFLVTINETNVVISNITGKQFNFDPTVNFTSQSVKGIDLTPLNDTAFVAGFCYTGQRMFSIISTDGTIINNSISAGGGASSGNCVSYDDIHVATLSTSLFATVVYNYNNDNEYLTFYNASAGNMTVALIYAKSVNSFYTGITALNSTDVMACNKDLSAGKLNCSQYHYNGYGVVPTKISGYTTVNYGSVGAGTTPIDPKAFNSTTYVACYVDYTGTEVNFTILTASGTILVNPVQVDSNLLQVGYVRCSALDDHTFVIGYYDATLKQYKSAVYYSNGTKRSGNTVVDDTGTSTTRTLGVAGFNATTYAYGDFNTTLYRFSIWNADNALLIANQTVSTVSGGSAMAVTSREFAPNIRFCSANDTVNQYLVVAYVYSTTQSNFTTYFSNGTAWNGVCPSGGGPPACTDTSFSVVWNGPLNNTWNQSQTITHSYTPTWGCSAVMANCSLWTNKTGAFTLAGSNATPLTNNSINTISFNYAVDSPNIWAYINCTNTSGTSNFTNNYTIKIDTTAPSTPTLTLASSGETWINLNIGSCTDTGSGVLKKLLYRNGTNIANLTSETTYNDTPLSGCATAYSYLLGCLDNVGWYGSNSTQLNTNTNHSTAPTTPAGLANTTISSSCIDLDWNDCTATGCTIDTYRIFRNSSLAGTNTTSFFHECGLTNCTSYGYTVDVNDTGGLHSANSSSFVYTTNGCYVPPPADRSPPTVNLTSPANGANRTSSSTTFICNASSNNTLANASLYSNFTGTWQLNETKSETGSSATESFTKTLTNGSYIWNCQWCNTFNNCSFAISNWSVNVNITPSAAGSGGLIFIQNGGGDWSMIDVFVTALIVLVFVYLHVHQEDPAWKIGYLMMALIMMSVTIVLTVQDLSISGKVVTSVVYDSGTSTYNLAYGSVTNTTSQQAILTSLLNPINWVLYLIIAVVLVGLMIKIVEYATTPRK